MTAHDDIGRRPADTGTADSTRQAGNRERAAEVWDRVERDLPIHGRYVVTRRQLEPAIAAALDAERERGRAEGRAEIAAKVRELADSYGRWPFRVDPLSVTRKLDLVAAVAAPAGQDEEAAGNAHPDMSGHCAHGSLYAEHCKDCEAGR